MRSGKKLRTDKPSKVHKMTELGIQAFHETGSHTVALQGAAGSDLVQGKSLVFALHKAHLLCFRSTSDLLQIYFRSTSDLLQI